MSIWLGFLVSYYYTFLFFGEVEWVKLLQLMAIYSIWVLLIVTFVVTASAALPNSGLAVASAFAAYLIFQLVAGSFGMNWSISPV